MIRSSIHSKMENSKMVTSIDLDTLHRAHHSWTKALEGLSSGTQADDGMTNVVNTINGVTDMDVLTVPAAGTRGRTHMQTNSRLCNHVCAVAPL